MKTIYIVSSGWLSNRQRCENLIDKIIRTNPKRIESIVLDAATVQREMDGQCGDCGGRSCIVEIDFRTWINETLTERGVINIQAVRRSAALMAEDKAFVINAMGFDVSTILGTLHQLRIGFYPLARWPRSLVLIGDDAQIHQLSPVLANTFYIRPSIVPRVEINRIVSKIELDGFLIRILGRRIGFSQKLTNYMSGWFAKHQQKKQREFGWIIEE